MIEHMIPWIMWFHFTHIGVQLLFSINLRKEKLTKREWMSEITSISFKKEKENYK